MQGSDTARSGVYRRAVLFNAGVLRWTGALSADSTRPMCWAAHTLIHLMRLRGWIYGFFTTENVEECGKEAVPSACFSAFAAELWHLRSRL